MQEIQEPGNLTQILEILCTGTCPKASIAEKGAYALRKLRPGRKVCDQAPSGKYGKNLYIPHF